MPVEVLLSTFHPQANSRNAIGKGHSALFTGTTGRKLIVKVDSYMMRHHQAPGDGLGFECIFPDTGERAFVSCDQLTVIRPDEYREDGQY